ncbi:MAG: ClpXP protease specificity-enhancing factor, partial [Massilia sp.]
AFEPVLGNDDPDAQPTDSPASADVPPPAIAPAASAPTLSSVPTGSPEQRDAATPGDDEPPKKGGRPTLTRIK